MSGVALSEQQDESSPQFLRAAHTGPKGEDTFDLRFEIERFKAAQTLGEMGLDERGAFLGELAVDELIHLGEDLGT